MIRSPAALLRHVALAFALAMPLLLRASDEGAAEIFRSANQAYLDGEFEKARDAYQSLVDREHVAPGLFYNLGNAFYRLGEPGQAALWYQRTLVLDPGHPEARQNLRVLENAFQFLSPERSWLQQVTATVSTRSLVIIAATGAWAILVAVAALVVFRRTAFLVWALSIGAVFLLAAASLLFMRKQEPPVLSQAIVIGGESIARTGPSRDSKGVITLPPGSQVRPVADRKPWVYIGIPEDLRGWIQSDEIAPLWPFDPSFLD